MRKYRTVYLVREGYYFRHKSVVFCCRRYRIGKLIVFNGRQTRGRERQSPKGGNTHCVINDILRAGIVVNVNGHAAQGRDFGGELIEAGVVLPLALVGFGHFGFWGEAIDLWGGGVGDSQDESWAL